MSEKSIVLLSGGMDSLLAAFRARESTEIVEAIFFAYGQRNQATERAASMFLAKQLGITWKEILVPLKQVTTSGLMGNGPTDKDPRDPKQFGYFVPGRNALFFTYAFIRAYTLRANTIYSGICQTSDLHSPDTTKEFGMLMLEAMNTALGTCSPEDLIHLCNPVVELERWEVFKEAALISPRALGLMRWNTHTGFNADRSVQWDWGYAGHESSLDPAQRKRREAWFKFCQWLENTEEGLEAHKVDHGNNPM